MAEKESKIVKKPLTKDQFNDLKAVASSPFEFSKHIYVVNPVKGKVRFHLYPYQIRVLMYFLTERFNIILKFRQAGLTELISMYALWLAMYHPNKNIQIISIKDRVAKKVLRKIKFMYKNLPEHIQVPIVNGRSGEYGTATEMEFANGSIISSVPTTEDAGRSEAVTLLVIDEAAIVRWASTIWAAAFPTLSTGGSAIINSTPYGVGNWYHQTWVDAMSGGNPFNPIRLYWHMHPDRDIDWYQTMREVLGPRRTAQEVDGDFLSSGYSVFDLGVIREIEECLYDYTPIEKRYNGSLILYNEPDPNKQYYIGADVATGRARDYSAFTLMDGDGEEAGCFKGKVSTSKFAQILMEIGHKYNMATIAPETNDVGLAVTSKLQDEKYPKLYYSKKILKRKKEKKARQELIPGWLTTTKNRELIINQLEFDLRKDHLIIKDPFFVQEAYTFIYDESNRPVALGKNKKSGGGDDEDDTQYTDDSILGKAITNFIRKGNNKGLIVAPK